MYLISAIGRYFGLCVFFAVRGLAIGYTALRWAIHEGKKELSMYFAKNFKAEELNLAAQDYAGTPDAAPPFFPKVLLGGREGEGDVYLEGEAHTDSGIPAPWGTGQ